MNNIYQNYPSGGKNVGFTLIELLVVVLIIGILSAVALPQYQKAVQKSRITQLTAHVTALYTAATSYYLANGVYPLDIRDLDLDITGGGTVKKSDLTTSDAQGVVFSNGIKCVSSLSGALCLDERSGLGVVKLYVGEHKGRLLCGNYSQKDTAEEICKSVGSLLYTDSDGRNFYAF